MALVSTHGWTKSGRALALRFPQSAPTVETVDSNRPCYRGRAFQPLEPLLIKPLSQGFEDHMQEDDVKKQMMRSIADPPTTNSDEDIANETPIESTQSPDNGNETPKFCKGISSFGLIEKY